MLPKSVLVACTLGLAGCTGSQSSAESPLTAEDRALIERVTRQSLESNRIGEAQNWRNAESDHGGNVTPLLDYSNETGKACRNFQQTVAIDGRTTMAYDSACRQADGNWASINYASLSAAIAAAQSGSGSALAHPQPDIKHPQLLDRRLIPSYAQTYGLDSGGSTYRYRPSRYLPYRYRPYPPPHFGSRPDFGQRYSRQYRYRSYHH